MADQRRYQEAQQIKRLADAIEEKEKVALASGTDSSLVLRERNLRKQHQSEMDVLKKRIESKRREYTKQRDEACSKLLQRNKNIQSTFDSKHTSECLTLASKIEQHVKSLINESG